MTRRRPGRQSSAAPVTTAAIEITVLPGLARVAADETRRQLPRASPPEPVPGRQDALRFRYTGPIEALHRLRTAVAAFRVLPFSVPRPQSLLHDAHVRRVAAAMDAICRGGGSPRSFRIEAAGRESPVMRRLAAAYEEASGLRFRPVDGDLPVRLRRTPGGGHGWEVLVRTSARPLSVRAWRVANYRGAANATVAAAMARMTGLRAGDRVANLMCGSGTLLVERLLAGPCRSAVGVDRSPTAIAAAEANVEAAGVASAVELHACDIADSAWHRGRRFDVILADPPWGTLSGDHRTGEAAHDLLLRVAYDVGGSGARLAVLTHEIKAMARALGRHGERWRVREVHKVFHKGHHPRIYLLDRR